MRISSVSVFINLLLFGSKLVIGLVINSVALIADSVHSFSDIMTSVIALLGFKISERPSDIEHPYGHQRAEYIASLIMAVILIVAGLEFIKEGINRLINHQSVTVSVGVLVFIVLTIVIKAVFGIISDRIGKIINSQSVKADTVHHFTDAFSSFLVLVAVWGSGAGYLFLDGAGGVLVGLILLFTGISIARKSADYLLGKPPSKDLILKIKCLCLDIEDVINIHDIVVHSYGTINFISLHVEIEQSKSSTDAHNIADKVERELKRELSAYTIVHIDPIDTDSDDIKDINVLISELVDRKEDIVGYHDLRLIDHGEERLILFDLVPDSSKFQRNREIECRNWFVRELRERFPEFKVEVNIDPYFTYN